MGILSLKEENSYFNGSSDVANIGGIAYHVPRYFTAWSAPAFFVCCKLFGLRVVRNITNVAGKGV